MEKLFLKLWVQREGRMEEEEEEEEGWVGQRERKLRPWREMREGAA